MKDFYSVSELADEFSVSPQLIRNWVNAKRFPNHQKIGRNIIIPRADVEVVRQEEAKKLEAEFNKLGFWAKWGKELEGSSTLELVAT